MTPSATAGRPRKSAKPAPDPEQPKNHTGDEVAAEMRTTRRGAREILESNGVPVVAFSERRWIVDAVAFRAFLARLEQQARERIEQRELQVDYLKPTAKGTAGR